MAVEKILFANCDTKGCARQFHFREGETQPHRRLVEVGWKVEPHNMTTYCPDHS